MLSKKFPIQRTGVQAFFCCCCCLQKVLIQRDTRLLVYCKIVADAARLK
jgi:hypothetical protein